MNKDKFFELRLLQENSLRLQSELSKENEKFFKNLSEFNSLREYLVSKESLTDDNDRIEFIAILTKQFFLSKKDIPGYDNRMPSHIDGRIHRFQLNENKKELQIKGEKLGWDSESITYTFDLVEIFFNLFTQNMKWENISTQDEESVSPTKQTLLERDDDKMKSVIDSYFGSVKKIMICEPFKCKSVARWFKDDNGRSINIHVATINMEKVDRKNSTPLLASLIYEASKFTTPYDIMEIILHADGECLNDEFVSEWGKLGMKELSNRKIILAHPEDERKLRSIGL
jgi:hypothetical protein